MDKHDKGFVDGMKKHIGGSASKKAKVKAAKKSLEHAEKTSKPGEGKRFAEMEKVAKASGAENPAAVAAAVGRKKYGAKKFAKMAASGRKKA